MFICPNKAVNSGAFFVRSAQSKCTGYDWCYAFIIHNSMTDMTKFLLFTVLLTALIEYTVASEVINEGLRAELLEMVRVDQAMRNGEIKVDDYAEIDQKNTRRLEEIVLQFGWPTSKLVGEDGSDAAWLLAQHADLKPEFQKKVLQLMEPLVLSGEVQGRHYGYLYDRTHQPQKFGTQGNCVGNQWEPREMEDSSKVESLRKEYGMMPFAEYKQMATDRLCANKT